MRRIAFALAIIAALLGSLPSFASQSTLTTPGAPLTMAQLATFLNNALATIATNYSGSTPPSVCTGSSACTYQYWLDTSTSPRVLKIYDGAQWVSVGSLDTTGHAFSISTSQTVSAQVGTSYAILDANKGQLLTQSNGSSSAWTIAQAGTASSFNSGWFADIFNEGAGTLTLTPTVSTINGASSLVLKTGRGVRIVSDGTNYQVAGFAPIGDTGTGSMVLATSPTLVTPNIGVATATSINGNTITTGSGTLTLGAGKTATISNTLTLTATDGSTLAIGTGGTLGTAAYQSTGTSGATIPFLNGTNTWASGQTFSSAITYGGVTLSNAVTGTGSMVLSASPTFTGTVSTAAHTITSTSANAFAVGPSGTSSPTFNVDASTGSAVTGINIKSAASGAGVALSAISSATDEALKIDAKGAGTITLGGTSTGAITLTRATTLSAALTYGGVTLSNAVTGTGNMVLSASPTLTGTLTASVGSFSSTLASTAHTITSASSSALAVGLNGATTPALQIDASTATSITGIKIKSAATGGGVAISAIGEASNGNLTLDAQGSGTITIAGTSTGAITLSRATTLSAALTYGGVTLANSVTGTGSMVLSIAPTITGHPTIEGVTSTGATGSALLVFATSPTLTTPTLGVAAATSINKVAITAPASSATLTIADGKTLTASNSITLAGTDGKSLTLTNGLTVTTNDGTLAFGAASKTLTVNNSIALTGTDATVMTFPTTTATIARTDAAQTFTGVQTFSTPIALGSGGTAQATALAARGSSGLNIDACTSTGDANYAIQAADRCVYHTALSTARTDTLPAANSVNAGQIFYITDFRGVVTGSNTVTLQRAGADTINGVTSVVAMNAQYAAGIFWSDGSSRWTYFPASAGGGSGTVTQIVFGFGLTGGTITSSGTVKAPLVGGFSHAAYGGI